MNCHTCFSMSGVNMTDLEMATTVLAVARFLPVAESLPATDVLVDFFLGTSSPIQVRTTDINDLPQNVVGLVVKCLETRRFPSLALLNRQWRQDVKAVVRRHDQTKGTLIWGANATQSLTADAILGGVRLVVRSTPCYCWTVPIPVHKEGRETLVTVTVQETTRKYCVVVCDNLDDVRHTWAANSILPEVHGMVGGGLNHAYSQIADLTQADVSTFRSNWEGWQPPISGSYSHLVFCDNNLINGVELQELLSLFLETVHMGRPDAPTIVCSAGKLFQILKTLRIVDRNAPENCVVHCAPGCLYDAMKLVERYNTVRELALELLPIQVLDPIGTFPRAYRHFTAHLSEADHDSVGQTRIRPYSCATQKISWRTVFGGTRESFGLAAGFRDDDVVELFD
jgi:hypothetical protein